MLLLFLEAKTVSHLICKGVCARYRATKPMGKLGRYETGQKRCMACEIFMRWEGRYCPCCKGRLRWKPRNKNKRMLEVPRI